MRASLTNVKQITRLSLAHRARLGQCTSIRGAAVRNAGEKNPGVFRERAFQKELGSTPAVIQSNKKADSWSIIR